MSDQPASPPRILIVDDTVAIHEDFRKILRPGAAMGMLDSEAALFGEVDAKPASRTFEVNFASQGQEAFALVQRAMAERRPYQVAFVDMRMPPGWDGIETIRHLWGVDPLLQVVICTAYSDYSWEETVRQLGESDSLVILKKPFDNIEVLQLAHALAKKWLVTQRDRNRLADLDELVMQRTASLRRSEQRFVQAFRANPVPVVLQATADGRFLDANEAFLKLTGHSRAALLEGTATSLELWPEADVWQESVDSISLGDPLRAHRAELRAADGATRHVLVSVAHAEIEDHPSVLTSIEDITDRLRVEDELRKAQKMEAVGQLAAGIAQDFNNLLTVIQSHSGNALADSLLAPEHRLGLNEILAAAERAGALTRQLLVSSRSQITQPKPVNVAACVANLRPTLTRLLPAQIQLQLKCDRDTPAIQADEANLEHLIVSLVTRARDGLPGCGRIRVALHPVEFDAAGVAGRTGARPGRFVCLSVGDDGNGIDTSEIAQLADPFSANPAGRAGTSAALGLGSVYAIAREHAGWVEVATVPGVGTTFEVFLPALDIAAPVAAPAAEASDLRGHGERVLLVEDEPGVRLAMRLTAERAGYHVTEASDAPTAKQTWTAAKEPFDLLVTDIVMPNGSNGIELASELRALQPSLRVILSTGYSRDLLAKEASELDRVHLIQKPCTPDEFLATVREALDAPVATA